MLAGREKSYNLKHFETLIASNSSCNAYQVTSMHYIRLKKNLIIAVIIMQSLFPVVFFLVSVLRTQQRKCREIQDVFSHFCSTLFPHVSQHPLPVIC